MTPREQAILEFVARARPREWTHLSVDKVDMAYLFDRLKRYRTALERCAEGAFVVAERGKLVNVAKQALQEEQINDA